MAALVLAALPAVASAQLTYSVAPNPVPQGAQVNLTATMPALNEPGVLQQEIVQTIDKTKVFLTSMDDVKAPAGWVISFSTDGTNFTTTVPTTPAGWAAIVKVKAVGNINSDGTTAIGEPPETLQVASGSAEAKMPPSAIPASPGPGKDGWGVHFDNQGHVFNAYHHDSPPAIDCHNRSDGANCSANWPFSVSPYHTNTVSNVYVDNVHHHLWMETNSATSVGFVCVDISDIKNPAFCGGSAGTAYIGFGTNGSSVVDPDYDLTGDIAYFDGKVFTWSKMPTGKPQIYCVDINARGGLGAPCTAPVPAFTTTSPSPLARNLEQTLIVHRGQVYGFSNQTLVCFDAATMAKCTGWDEYEIAGYPQTSQFLRPYLEPDATGVIQGICVTMGGSTRSKCVSIGGANPGTAYDGHAGLGTAINATQGPVNVSRVRAQGSKVFWSGTYANNKLFCYDVAAAGGAGAYCPNWGGSSGIATNQSYTVEFDPDNDTCMWTNGNAGVIQNWDIGSGSLGCKKPPADPIFRSNVIVPSLSCYGGDNSVKQWLTFKLDLPAYNGGAGYVSATLTVLTEDGVEVPGWSNLPLPPDGVVDISKLPVADSGPRPSFWVKFVGRADPSTPAAATVKAVGDPPQLCLAPMAVKSCPVTLTPLGPITPSMLASVPTFSTTAYADGTWYQTPPKNVQTQVSQTFDLEPSGDACGSPITGTALDTANTPVPGAVVKLYNAAGTSPITVNWAACPAPASPCEVTATTGADGSYAFPALVPGSYTVKFSDTDAAGVLNSTVTWGAAGTSTGTRNASGGAVTSKTVAVSADVDGIANAVYGGPLVASPDKSIGPEATPQLIDVLANDVPSGSPGATLVPGSVMLCGSGEASPDCTQTGLAVPGEGTYSVNPANGKVTFTPCAGPNDPAGASCVGPFVGVATPVGYQVSDSTGKTAGSTISPEVLGSPSASNDATTTTYNTPVGLDAAANDAAWPPGGTLDLGSIDLDPSTPGQQTTLTLPGQGTFALDPANPGAVVFTPASGFSGVATIPYTIADALGQTSNVANLTVTVLGPTESTQPLANNDAATTPKNTTVILPALLNDAPSSGSTLVPSSVKLCGSGETPNNCTQTEVYVAGEGIWTVDPATGDVEFKPEPGYTGVTTPLPYIVKDAANKTATATLTVTVTGGGSAPVAYPDVGATDAKQPVTVQLLSNDSPSDGKTWNLASLKLCGPAEAPNNCTRTTLDTAQGTYVVNTDGGVTFTPCKAAGDPNASCTGTYTGTTPPVPYQVADTSGKIANSTLTIVVNPTSLTATDDSTSTLPATPVKLTPASNDLALPGAVLDPSTIRLCSSSQTAPNCNLTTLNTAQGTFVVNADGSVTFTPCSGAGTPNPSCTGVYTGTTPPAPYQISDSLGNVASATLTVTVKPLEPDVNATFVGMPVTGNMSTNDGLPPGVTFGDPGAPASQPPGSTATITMSPDGTYTFTANKPGVYVYNVPVCAPGQTSGCPTETLTITVTDPSGGGTRPPLANTDIGTTPINTPVTLPTLANDLATAPGATLNPASVTVPASGAGAPAHGSTTVNPATGAITYTPAPGFSGVDTYTYQVCDNQVPPQCASAVQQVTVLPAGAPNSTIAADDYGYTTMNVPVSGNLLVNDVDPQSNTLTATPQTTTIPGKGTLVLAADGTYTFTPALGYVGPANFPYQACDNGTPQACASATLYLQVGPVPEPQPDINATFVNAPVTGDVSTNDQVPPGVAYGNPGAPAVQPPGSTASITMNPDGTYTFTGDKPGVYVYNVPVCPSGQTTGCPTEPLTITVVNPNGPGAQPPLANTDIAATPVNTPVTLKTLANDAATAPATSLVPSTVRVTTPPAHGTVSVNPANGNITYTPAPGFTGVDTYVYRVCDTQVPAQCTSALQQVTVLPATDLNTTLAVDDYGYTTMNVPVSGNVLANDVDPQGNPLTVTPQTTTIPGKGTLVLAADGTYTFTPVAGYTGPVNYPYQACDNGTPQACASATLYLLVGPPSEPEPDVNATFVNVPVPGDVSTNDQVAPGTTYGNPGAPASQPVGSTATITMKPDGTYTFTGDKPGVYVYNVPICAAGQTTGCPTERLTITVTDPAGGGTRSPIADTDIAVTTVDTPVSLNTLANDAALAPGTTLVPSSVQVTTPPAHGTTSVDPATGRITYTPNSGWTGVDTYVYQVCDNGAPPQCASAVQEVTVLPANGPNSTLAADDYRHSVMGMPVSGNLLTNDIDPQGNTRTTTPQTTTIPGKGTLVLGTNGTYSFRPAPGYVGPVNFPYEVCDNGTPPACAEATLYILIEPPTPVPTLGEWALYLLSLLLAGSAMARMRRQR